MDLKTLLETVRVGEKTVLDVAGGDKDRKLTVELRRLLPEEPRAPKRAESPPRKHEFLSAPSLADYLGEYGDAATVVFADPENETISAVLEEISENGFEVVTMKPAPHPLWKPWAAIAGRWLPIEEFADFVMQNRRPIIHPEGRDLAYSLSQVRATVKAEISRGRGRAKGPTLNGLVVTTEIRGQPSPQQETVDLPDQIVIEVPLYVETDARKIELDLCLRADSGGKIEALLTAGGVLEARVKAFEEMVAEVRKRVPAGAVLTFGRPAHGSWAYLKELAVDKPS